MPIFFIKWSLLKSVLKAHLYQKAPHLTLRMDTIKDLVQCRHDWMDHFIELLYIQYIFRIQDLQKSTQLLEIGRISKTTKSK